MEIRPETPPDASAISKVIDQAFAGAKHSDGTEAAIVERLRDTCQLTLSLVAVEAGEIVGHVAYSPIVMTDGAMRWFGLGPVAVRPGHQNVGIGRALIEQGLDRLRTAGANGCVVLGDPAYYRRFGFIADPRLRFPGPPPEYFQALAFRGDIPHGEVAYHAAFAGP